MKNVIALPIVFVFISSAYATPNDLFSSAKNLQNTQTHTLETKFSLDMVNDTIDVFNIKEKEGITDNSIGDYEGLSINTKYQINTNWDIEAGFWHRNIEYGANQNKIQSASLSLLYTPTLNLNAHDALTFRTSLWGNKADTLEKRSPTQVNQYTFENVNVINPYDFQFQIDSIFSKKIDRWNQINTFASLGYSQVVVDQINVQAKQAGCLMNVQINNNNQYDANLNEACSVNGLVVEELTTSGNANEFGLDMDKDLNYESYYANLGGSWTYQYKKFESQLAYQYQRLWRKDIDNRVANFGNNPIKDNHTYGAKFSYHFHPKASVFLQGEMYKNNFVGKIPFLYNGVTASRLDKKYGLASLGLTFKAF